MIDLISSPFALLLRYLSQLLNNYGLALIVFATIVTLIRIPFDLKSKRGMMKMSLLQPKIKAIQEKYAGNQAKFMQEQQKLHKEEGVNPLGGCVWMLFPTLILLILFGIIRQPLTHLMGLGQYELDALREALAYLGVTTAFSGGLYQVEMAGYILPYYDRLRELLPDIFNTTQIFPLNMNFLGMNIGAQPNWQVFLQGGTAQDFGLATLPAASMIAAYLSQKIMMATNYMTQPAQQAQMMKTMMLMMPVVSLVIGFTFPAAMSLYWTASSLLFAFASIFINLHFRKIYAGMKADMEARDLEKQAEIEAKRRRTAALKEQGQSQENKGTSKKKKQAQEREKERQRLAANKAGDLEMEEEPEEDPSRVGHRKFARGRAYDPDRFMQGADEPLEELQDVVLSKTEDMDSDYDIEDDNDYDAEESDYEMYDDDYYDDDDDDEDK